MDPGYRASGTDTMIKTLEDIGADVTYIELKGYGHNIWDYVYEESGILDWFLQYQK
jgi:hypothetical protein